MMQTRYLVTKVPESDGCHFLHSENCQVLPELEMQDLGQFETCAPAMEQAAEIYAPLNACALCCSDCYIKTGDSAA
ncbi:MAG: hypothetical protein RID11_09190 [Roseovarius sp.]|jgi:hypothetical protein|uniref:hypothetical protein n=1 Tax=Roseovarius sp. TaxID=1486281 RepID=UPI0032EB7D8F